MYLRQFKYLIAIVEEGHFGRAALRCNATQPSLSSGIKQLEIELGIPIFLRGRGQRLQGLTPEGQTVVKWARQIISDCDAMRNELGAMQGDLRGDLRIGAMSSMSPVLPMILKVVRAQFPNVSFDVKFIGHEAIKSGLDNYSIDVAFFYMDSDTLGRRNVLPLYTEQFSLLVPDVPEYAGRKTISWSEAARLPLAMLRRSMHERRFVDEVFESLGLDVVARIESESILHLMFQVQFSELCTIIPSHFARLPGLHPGTRALALTDPVRSRQVGVFWAEVETILPMASAMVSAIQQLDATQELRNVLESSGGPVAPPPRPASRRLAPRSLPPRTRPTRVHPS